MSHAITKGGSVAHVVRRAVHVSILLVAYFFYYILVPRFSVSVLDAVILVFVLCVILFECIRIRFRIVLFAQRSHEATQFSAFGWTMVALSCVFLFSPSVAYAMPIVAGCALGDPILGELRLRNLNPILVFCVGVLVLLAVWFVAANEYGIHHAWAFLMAPLVVAVEWPSFKYIDDNALMMLAPLLVIKVAGLLY